MTMHPPNLGYSPRHRRETRHPLQGGVTKRDTLLGVSLLMTPLNLRMLRMLRNIFFSTFFVVSKIILNFATEQ